MSTIFLADGFGTKELTKWWLKLDANRGARASLRRCKSPTEVMFQPAFIHLCTILESSLQDGYSNWQERLARVVGLLSQCDPESQGVSTTLARSLAGDSKPIISELRFRRLLQEKPDDLYLAMIRVLRMLKRKANLADLINSTYYWNDRVRKNWAFDYYPHVPESKSA